MSLNLAPSPCPFLPGFANMPATPRPGHWHPRRAEAQTRALSYTSVCTHPRARTHTHMHAHIRSGCWVRAGLRTGTSTSTEGSLTLPGSHPSRHGPWRVTFALVTPPRAQMHTVPLIQRPPGLEPFLPGSMAPYPGLQTRLAFCGRDDMGLPREEGTVIPF